MPSRAIDRTGRRVERPRRSLEIPDCARRGVRRPVDAPIIRDGLLLTDIGRRFSPEQRAIYDIVLAAQHEAIPLMRPGHTFIDAHTRAVDVVVRELLELGLVTKNTAEQAGLYLFHGAGHPLGLQTRRRSRR
jgi:hypothetical protein